MEFFSVFAVSLIQQRKFAQHSKTRPHSGDGENWRFGAEGRSPHSSAKLESDVFAADVPAAKTLAPLVGTEAIEKFYAIIFQIPHSP